MSTAQDQEWLSCPVCGARVAVGVQCSVCLSWYHACGSHPCVPQPAPLPFVCGQCLTLLTDEMQQRLRSFQSGATELPQGVELIEILVAGHKEQELSEKGPRGVSPTNRIVVSEIMKRRRSIESIFIPAAAKGDLPAVPIVTLPVEELPPHPPEAQHSAKPTRNDPFCFGIAEVLHPEHHRRLLSSHRNLYFCDATGTARQHEEDAARSVVVPVDKISGKLIGPESNKSDFVFGVYPKIRLSTVEEVDEVT